MPRPRLAVVFDFDGIVLDSETPEFESHRRIFEACGARLGLDEWTGQIGKWVDGRMWFGELCRRAARPIDEPTFEAEKRRLFGELVRMEPLPGILTLLEELRDRDVPRGIASSSPARWVLRALADLGLADRFDTVVTSDDVTHRKPAPDVYLEATRRLGVPANQAVAIEDSMHGLAAARAAGMTVVAIPHALTATHDLSAAHLQLVSAEELTVERLARLVETRQTGTRPEPARRRS